jgi:hypothetical protein
MHFTPRAAPHAMPPLNDAGAFASGRPGFGPEKP